jgi:hypothetical protein
MQLRGNRGLRYLDALRPDRALSTVELWYLPLTHPREFSRFGVLRGHRRRLFEPLFQGSRA